MSDRPDWLGRSTYRAPVPPEPSDSPVFVACFADRTTIRMSVYAFIRDLDSALPRAVALARAAFQSRKRPSLDAAKAAVENARDAASVWRAYAELTAAVPVPAITAAHFQTTEGTILKTCTTEQLEQANKQKDQNQ